MFGITAHRRLQEAVAGMMHKALPFSLVEEVDMSEVCVLRAKLCEKDRHATYTAVILKAIALAIQQMRKEYPIFNSYYLRWPFRRIVPTFEIRAAVMVARTVDGEDHALVGIIPNPDKMRMDEISQCLHDYSTIPAEDVPDFQGTLGLQKFPLLIQRLAFFVAANVLRLRRRYNGTFWLTTVGKYGPDIQIPSTMGVAFAFGAIRDRVVAVGGRPAVRPTMYLTAVLDRRLFSGAPAAQLLNRIKELLEHPERLLTDEMLGEGLESIERDAVVPVEVR
ncbi:MAG: 2-oxo acid dehydrogenase subunit E2 [Planctomycetota bacterium]